jgi:hypothetical protein
MSGRNPIETNAMCMVWGIACIAKEKDFFVIGFATNGAGSGLLFLEFVLDPCIWIELCHLFLVLDLVFGYDGAWRKIISILNFASVYATAPLGGGDL